MFTGLKQASKPSLGALPVSVNDWAPAGFPTPQIQCNCQDVSGGLFNSSGGAPGVIVGNPSFQQPAPNGRKGVLMSGAQGFTFNKDSANYLGVSGTTFIYLKFGALTGSQRAIMGKRLSPSNGWFFTITPSTRKFRVRTYTGITTSVISTGTAPLDTWVYAALTIDRDSNIIKITTETSSDSTPLPNPSLIDNQQNLELGLSTGINTQSMTVGYFAHFNVALTDEQIRSLGSKL